MEKIKQLYINATKPEEITNYNIFNQLIELNFKDKIDILKELIIRGPKEKFDFYKIEALTKYISMDNYFEVLAAIKYVIKNISDTYYLEKTPEFHNLIISLENYQQELLSSVSLKNNYTRNFVLTILFNKYQNAVKEYITQNNDKNLLISLEIHNRITNILLNNSLVNNEDIYNELTKITFKNFKEDFTILYTVETYINSLNIKEDPIVHSSR